MAEWLYEEGIGENRAALVDQDQILAVRLERPSDGPRLGAIMMARLVEAGVVELDDPLKSLANVQGRISSPLGSRFKVEVVRMALKERGRDKLARVRLADEAADLHRGETLYDRISAQHYPIISISSAMPGEDRLEAAGWSEMIERAQRGYWEFSGGALWIDPTPAMVMIDIDGEAEGLILAKAGARACVAAIEAFDMGGPIGIDVPSLKGRAERAEVDGLIDQLLPLPFERTGTNGFGFLQIIRKRQRPSFIEQICFDRVRTDAALLLRKAERAQGFGSLDLIARPAVMDLLQAHPDWTARLQQITGRSVCLKADAGMKGSGHAQ